MSNLSSRRSLSERLAEAIRETNRLREKNKELTRKLYEDELTRLSSRRFFEDNFPRLVEIAKDSNEPLALLIADVNGLKRTNDALGHKKGDELLMAVAEALKRASRDTDISGRLGGDEFYVILPGFCPIDGQSKDQLLEQTSDRFKKFIDQKISSLSLPVELAVNVSFGIAILESSEDYNGLYHRADEICQLNKRKVYENLKQQGKKFEDERAA